MSVINIFILETCFLIKVFIAMTVISVCATNDTIYHLKTGFDLKIGENGKPMLEVHNLEGDGDISRKALENVNITSYIGGTVKQQNLTSREGDKIKNERIEGERENSEDKIIIENNTSDEKFKDKKVKVERNIMSKRSDKDSPNSSSQSDNNEDEGNDDETDEKKDKYRKKDSKKDEDTEEERSENKHGNKPDVRIGDNKPSPNKYNNKKIESDEEIDESVHGLRITRGMEDYEPAEKVRKAHDKFDSEGDDDDNNEDAEDDKADDTRRHRKKREINQAIRKVRRHRKKREINQALRKVPAKF